MTYEQLKDEFIEIYGGDKSGLRIFEAPGRVNLIGEHTDYNGGYVFPAALTFANTIIIREINNDIIKLAVTSLPDRVEASIDNLNAYRSLKWGNYQLGVAYMLQQAGYKIPSCEILYHGTVPYGGGLSSSAAIEVVMALALTGLTGQNLDTIECAKLCQKAENQYCGMNCGIMDQFASAMGKKDHAILLNCNTLKYRHVPVKLEGYKIVLTNTNKPHSLIESKYNERRSECDTAFAILKGKYPALAALCHATMAQLDSVKGELNQVVYRRAKHAITENQRCLKAVELLEKNDIKGFGALMMQSHESLSNDYEVTGAELDALYQAARELDGVVGVRMTGAGFGGCTVAIVKEDDVEAYKQNVAAAYTKETGYTPTFYVCEIGDGGREIL